MLKTAIAAILAAACLLALAAAHAQAQTQTQNAPLTISGKVLNRTPQAAAVSGIAVTLHMQGESTYDSAETTTDDNGNFTFGDIAYDPALIYAVSVRYQDALYGTEITEISLDADGAPTAETVEVVIEVYDAVYEQDVIRIGSASLLFADADRLTQTVSALEIVKVINDSDFTFVPGSGGPMSLLRFGLPPDAAGLQVDTRLLGADIVQVDRGFAVIGSVPPGEHDIMFTYAFPYDGTETTFTKSFPFGADSLRVLSPNEVLTLASEDIGAPEPVQIGERPYQLIEAAAIDRGRRVNVRLSDLPRATIADRMQSAVANARYEYAAPALLAVFLAALIPFAILRHRHRKTTERQHSGASAQSGGGAESIDTENMGAENIGGGETQSVGEEPAAQA